MFVIKNSWLRDNYLCVRCGSIPRNRALIHVLQTGFPGYRSMKVHESSPCGAASDKLQRECRDYTPTYFYPEVPPGGYKNGVRCENIEHMTFEDGSFDLMITQDVMEHVLNPGKAFEDIARVLKPGGAHVFTVPIYKGKKTLVRAVEAPEGVKYLEEAQYHGNPIDRKGSLVVTEWGEELIEFITLHGGLATTVHRIVDRKLGIDGEFLEVLVSRKPAG